MDTQKLQTLVNAADAAHEELIQATEDLSNFGLREQGPQIARINELRKAHYHTALQVVAAVRTQLNFPALSEVSRVQNASQTEAPKRFLVAEQVNPTDGFEVVENIWEAHQILSGSHEVWRTFRTKEEADAECKRLNDDYDRQLEKELELYTSRGPVIQDKLY